MEQRLSMISLGVADLKRAVAFYQDVIGWTAAPGPPGIAFFDLGGIVFSLYPHEDLAKDLGAVETGEIVSQGFALAHNARSKEDVDAIFARLKEHGDDHQTARGSLLGRIFRLFFRPGRP